MAEEWRRPESVPFPSTWNICVGRKPLPNGKVPRFRIQDVTDDLIEPLVHHMSTRFLADEPFCKHLDIINDKGSVEEMAGLWRECLKARVGLIALLDNPDEVGDDRDAYPLVAGCNATFPLFPHSKDPVLENQKLKSILNVVNEVSHKVDCFTKYNASVCLYAFGLSVDPAYRGQGLAEPILRARYSLGRAVGIPLTVTVFTGVISQTTARNAGFEYLAEIKPEDFVEDGKTPFLGVNSKCVKLMAAEIPLE